MLVSSLNMKRMTITNITRWGKLFAKGAIKFFGLISVVLPIHPKRIVFISHREGSHYDDSPKYISEYLQNAYKDEFEIVWIVNNPSSFDYLKEKGVRVVRFGSLRDYVYSNTSQVYVSNLFGPPWWVTKRHQRLIVETSHGTAYKSLMSKGVGASSVGIPEILGARWKINTADICMSGNAICSDYVYRGELGYKGEILEVGLPRNDTFFSEAAVERKRVRECFGLCDEKRIALVMPTWNKDNSRINVEIDYKKLTKTLSDQYGGEWIVLLRLHHLSQMNIEDLFTEYSDCLFDATHYPGVQDLLCTGDLLITDYSSVIWDFALRELPVLVFAADRETYRQDRGFNVPPEDWGLVSSSTTEELVDVIRKYSYEDLCNASRKHLQRFGCFETGHATEEICHRIAAFCGV